MSCAWTKPKPSAVDKAIDILINEIEEGERRIAAARKMIDELEPSVEEAKRVLRLIDEGGR